MCYCLPLCCEQQQNDKPMRIPRLKIAGEEQKAEWQAAEKRREMRMQRRKEGF